jgi:hypothetical protein
MQTANTKRERERMVFPGLSSMDSGMGLGFINVLLDLKIKQNRAKSI